MTTQLPHDAGRSREAIKGQELEELVERMRDRRDQIFAEVAETDEDLRRIAEEREAELEERAQEERLAWLLVRLDDRAKQEIKEIHEALRRVLAGTYGTCEGCKGRISIERLRAVPATRLCVECAREAEAAARQYGPGTEEELVYPQSIPVEEGDMSDSELETWLRDLVREDGRVDMDEVRIVCRRGVVRLEGAVSSEAEHQILLGLVQDVAGMQEVEDRLDIRQEPRELNRIR